jgi:hypothetical protein
MRPLAVRASHCRARHRGRARPPLLRTPPWLCVPPFTVWIPCCRLYPLCRVHPPLPPRLLCVPPFAVSATLCLVRLSHPCTPLSCAPPKYKFHKVVVHSTTWASGPLTTERWLTAGCLGGDHSFYIHSHSHAQGCDCMHVTFHVIFLYSL